MDIISKTPLTHDVISIAQDVIIGKYEIPEWTTSVMKRAYEPTEEAYPVSAMSEDDAKRRRVG